MPALQESKSLLVNILGNRNNFRELLSGRAEKLALMEAKRRTYISINRE